MALPAALNLELALAQILFLGSVGLVVVFAYGVSMYRKKHANDPISKRSAEWSVALSSCGIALLLVLLVYAVWGFGHEVVLFNNVAVWMVGAVALSLAGSGSYLAHGRTVIQLLRVRKEWR